MARVETSPDYAHWLAAREGLWWKRWLGVQRPYRRHLERLKPGVTLDVGCGLGRNLRHLPAGSLGVDSDPAVVAMARSRGLSVLSPAELEAQRAAREGTFSTLLFSHVLEHLDEEAAATLVGSCLPYLAAGGRCVIVVPQQAGFDADPTHRCFVSRERARELCSRWSLRVVADYSFPLPRLAGRWFRYNESVVVARRT